MKYNGLTGLDFTGIDGREDTRLIYGIIVVEERDRLVKEGKVHHIIFCQLLQLQFAKCFLSIMLK